MGGALRRSSASEQDESEAVRPLAVGTQAPICVRVARGNSSLFVWMRGDVIERAADANGGAAVAAVRPCGSALHWRACGQ
jgi:hypothetical protein